MSSTRREFLGAGAAVAAGAALTGHLLGCGQELDCDVCIVGSGFAGTHLGIELARQGHRVVVVEAGARRDAATGGTAAQDLFEYRNTGEIAWPVDSGREIAVGGTSNKWGGVVNRLRPTDFEMASRFGLAVDWPIGYDELDPYYCRAEALLVAHGFAPHPGEPPRECSYPQVTRAYVGPRKMLESESAEFFGVARSRRDRGPVRLVSEEIPAFEALGTAELLSDTRAVRLLCRDGREIDSLEVIDRDGQKRELRARLFVVAAGAVESPRLLLLSTSDIHPAGVGNNHDQVGRFLTVHPIETTLIPKEESLAISKGPHRTYSLTEPFRERGLFGCSFQLKEIPGRGLEWKMQPEVEPRVENRVELSESDRDAHGIPLPVVSLTYSDRDQSLFTESRQILLKEAHRLAGQENPLDLRTNWRFHPAGACRMGFEPANGVVDSDCKVFGFDNLFVSGACVFPTSGTSNPTLSVVALTLRLSEHLMERVL